MLLRDADIRDLLEQKPQSIAGVPDVDAPYTLSTSIQPASLDLRVGEIVVPEIPDGAWGSATRPASEYNLRPGETAVVQTRETFQLPGNCAGIAFPPDSMSKNGLLMTNPGHVDPGYHGKLKFTLINMGKTEALLKVGEPIATLLLIRLDSDADKGWITRHDGRAGAGVTPEMLAKLTRDFMGLEQRTTEVARKELTRIGIFVGAATIVLAGIAAGATVIPSVLFAPTSPSSHDLAVLEVRLNATEMKLASVNKRLAKLQQQIVKKKGP
jgi:dCTP deaminase